MGLSRRISNKNNNQQEVMLLQERGGVFISLIKQTRGCLGVIVIVVGNGHGDTSSNPGRD